jgi:hypothetical protein
MRTNEGPARKRMGRPPLPRERAKLHSLGLRTSHDNYRTVHGWSARSGKSVAQELEGSIEFRRIYEQMFEGPLRKPNITMLATFEHAGKASSRWLPEAEQSSWLSDKGCYRAALAETIMAMLEAGPEGFTEESAKAVFDLIGRRLFSRSHSGFVPPDPAEPPSPEVTFHFDETGNTFDKEGNLIAPAVPNKGLSAEAKALLGMEDPPKPRKRRSGARRS